jgi:hypothetical protein
VAFFVHLVQSPLPDSVFVQFEAAVRRLVVNPG